MALVHGHVLCNMYRYMCMCIHFKIHFKQIWSWNFFLILLYIYKILCKIHIRQKIIIGLFGLSETTYFLVWGRGPGNNSVSRLQIRMNQSLCFLITFSYLFNLISLIIWFTTQWNKLSKLFYIFIFIKCAATEWQFNNGIFSLYLTSVNHSIKESSHNTKESPMLTDQY